jgi:hypothetical protein
MARRVTIVTAGHLATCPRMLKAADTLHDAGYEVKVISTSQTPWAAAADRRLYSRRGWRWECIPYDRATAPWHWFRTGVRHRVAEALVQLPRLSGRTSLAAQSYSRVHAELVRAILREPQDFIYGGTSGALSAVTEASRRSATPCAVDFEDFHCGQETAGAKGSARDEIGVVIMADAVRQASFVTAGSAAIGRACQQRFGVAPITINNVFPLPHAPVEDRVADPLRLYWFSQTIGPDRGLEDVVHAVGALGVPAELHLRGAAIAWYVAELKTLCRTVAPRLQLVQHAPGDPDDMVNACRGFDVGLAVEPGHTLNNALSLSNKALTYPLAGLAMALTRTPGQRVLIDDLGEDAVSYAPGRFEDLAAGLARWHEDRPALQRARHASWRAACTRWRWDHPLERDALLAAVRAVA